MRFSRSGDSGCPAPALCSRNSGSKRTAVESDGIQVISVYWQLYSRAGLQSHIHKVGLTWAIFGSFTLALLLIFGSLYYFVPHQPEKFLTNKLIERGTAIARTVKRQVALKGREYDESAARTLNEI